jgi:hypothetical protein
MPTYLNQHAAFTAFEIDELKSVPAWFAEGLCRLAIERARNLPLHNDPPDAEKRRRAPDEKHESERNNLAARHNRELEAAAAKEHID